VLTVHYGVHKTTPDQTNNKYEQTNLENIGVSYFKNVFKYISYRAKQNKKTCAQQTF
jgi:hypothetical protein